MALPAPNPALPIYPNPYFQDNSFVRGDNQRANNGFIWQDMEFLDNKIDAAVVRILALENDISAGTVIPFAGYTIPTGTLLCDGSAISRTTYENLFNAIVPSRGTVTITIAAPGLITLNNHGFLTGESIYLRTTGAMPAGLSPNTLYYVVVNNANSFWVATTYANALANTRITTTGSQSGVHTLWFCPWGLGDGTTTFNIPDLRGAYLRGYGTSTLYAQNRQTVLGEMLSDQFQGHRHPPLGGGSFASSVASTLVFASSSSGSFVASTGDPITDTVNGTPRTGNETRPTTRGIKYSIIF